MKITIDNKAFELKFGFKCLMILGEEYGLKSFNAVVRKLMILEKLKDDLTFEQAELIEKLVESAVKSSASYSNLEYSIYDVSILDWAIANPDELAKVMSELAKSLPQGNPASVVKKNRKPRSTAKK